MQDAIPEMSGALPDSTSISQAAVESNVQDSSDQVLPAEDTTRSSYSEFSAARGQRRQSFFVVSDPRRDAAGNILPLEKIEIRPAQRAVTFEIGSSKKNKKKRSKQSSLDAILRHATNGPVHNVPGAQIPLPESRATSISSTLPLDTESSQRNSLRHQHKSSLDIIIRDGHSLRSIPLPTSIPLPESKPESLKDLSSQQQSDHQDGQLPQQLSLPGPNPIPRLPRFKYQQILGRASEVFQHLTNGRIHARSRHDILNLSYNDFSLTSSCEFVTNSEDNRDDNLFRALGDIPENVKQRLIVVEDLSPRTIDILGRRFGVNPELFEEHLINSGYEGAEYNDPPAHTWATSARKKSYISLKWYRPVFRLPMVPYSNQDLKDLLDPGISRLEYTSDNSNDLTIFETETNIFRSAWDLWTDPKTTARMKRTCGWEERATVWSQKLPGRDCRIVILLLDPLPKLGEGIERDVITARVIHDEDSDEGSSGSTSPTIGSSQRNYGTEALDRDTKALDRLAEHLKDRYVAQKPLTWAQRIMRRITFTTRHEEDASELPDAYEIVETKSFKKVRSRTIFEQIASRARIDISFEDSFQSAALMEVLRQQLCDTRSTHDEFCMRVNAANYKADNIGYSMVAPHLFQIVRRDAVNLLKVLHNALDSININILDDAKMEESLSIWRELITRAQLELPEMKNSIFRFFSFLEVLGPSAINPSPKTGPAEAQDDFEDDNIPRGFEDLSREIDTMLQRLQTASSSLTSNMALLDSRRSIAEAQAVTKLTELAFFFIPLTFAASIFGMQIEQFENRAPLSTFIGLGIGFTALSYMVRLAIRSRWLRGLAESYRESIKVYADKKRQPVRRGSVPASLFLSWLGYEIIAATKEGSRWTRTGVSKVFGSFWDATEFVIITILLVSTIAVGPIAVLWTRQMDHGIQSLITIIILVCVIGLVAVPYWRYADPETRSALPKLVRKKFKSAKFPNSKLLVPFVWIVALAVAVIPLTILWTKPVSPGIKAAVTVVVILIVVMGFVTYGISSLVSIARISLGSTGSSSSRSLAED